MRKQSVVDRFFRNLIEKYLFEVSLVLLLVVSVVIRISLAPNTAISPDYDDYFGLWVNYYKETGFFKGLGSVIGDYYAPLNYMYAFCSLFPFEPWVMLSIIPCVLEIVSAFFVGKILFLLTGEKKVSTMAGVATLFLPFVVMNGALWKQVDAIYSCVIMVAVYYLLKRNYRISIIWYAVALATKFQAIIFLPVYVILYFTEGFSTEGDDKKSVAGRGFDFLEFLWIPFVYFVLGIPEVLLKNGLRHTYLVYFEQASEMDTEGYGLTAFFPNLYNWGFDNYDKMLTVTCILTLFAVLVVLALVFYRHRAAIDRNMAAYMCIFVMWTCLMIMPGMHERYDYPMLLLLTPFAILVRKKLVWPMLLANLTSLMTYGIVVFHAEIFPMYVVSLIYCIAYLLTAIDLFRLLREGDSEVEV